MIFCRRFRLFAVFLTFACLSLSAFCLGKKAPSWWKKTCFTDSKGIYVTGKSSYEGSSVAEKAAFLSARGELSKIFASCLKNEDGDGSLRELQYLTGVRQLDYYKEEGETRVLAFISYDDAVTSIKKGADLQEDSKTSALMRNMTKTKLKSLLKKNGIKSY